MYQLPDEIKNDNRFKDYKHFNQVSLSPLEDDYCHYRRKDDPNDVEGMYYYGEWEDVTEEDRKVARIEEARRKLEELQKQIEKMQKEKNKLEKELNNGEHTNSAE